MTVYVIHAHRPPYQRQKNTPTSAPTLDERAAALSLNGQEMLRGFLGYLEQLDAAKAAPRRPMF